MSIHSAVAYFRGRQADMFVDTATVTRPGVGGTTNPSTGVFTPAAGTTVYSGPCLLRALAWEGMNAVIGEEQVRKRRVTAKFPVDTDIQVDDEVTPTASTYDSSLVGVPFRASDPFRDGFQICRRAICEEVIG